MTRYDSILTEHQQSVTGATNRIPIGFFIDCPHDISAALSEHIVLLIVLLLWLLCECVRLSVDNCIFPPSNVQPWKAGTGLTYLGIY